MEPYSENQYQPKEIYECIKGYFDSSIIQPSLREFSILALDYKLDEFVFSRLTFTHLEIWEEDWVDKRDWIKVMASVELFILSCDILDDLQDQDSMQAPWMNVETKFSMNLVYLFISIAKSIILDTTYPIEKKVSLLQLFLDTETISIVGQHQDLQKTLISEEEYIQIVNKKSGSLMALSCLAGSLNATEKECSTVNEYALNIGCSAQIENDLLGISEVHSYKDLISKSITLPIIYMFHLESESLEHIYDYYSNFKNKEEFLLLLPDLSNHIFNSGAIEYSRIIQLIHMEKASALLNSLYSLEHANKIKDSFLLKR